MPKLPVALLLLALAGCAGAASTIRANRSAISTLAANDMQCPESDIQVVNLDSRDEARQAEQISERYGASGCGHNAVYTLAPGGDWQLESMLNEVRRVPPPAAAVKAE